jgi:2'-5' RNA ligase
MRLFAAIELGQPLIASLDDQTRRLRTTLERDCPGLPIRWIPAANLHITLVFLGEVRDEGQAAIRRALAEPLEITPFDLTVSGFGVFPPGGALRGIWVGFGDGTSRAAAVHDAVVERLRPEGFEPEARGFTPHVTIARVREVRGSGARCARDVMRRTEAVPGTARVDGVTLFRSHLSPRGSTYEPLMRVPLQG